MNDEVRFTQEQWQAVEAFVTSLVELKCYAQDPHGPPQLNMLMRHAQTMQDRVRLLVMERPKKEPVQCDEIGHHGRVCAECKRSVLGHHKYRWLPLRETGHYVLTHRNCMHPTEYET